METPSRQIYLNKSGIYCLLNKINNKRYIGQAKSLYRRFVNHTKPTGKHTPYFTNAIKKYGWENFEFQILEECSIEQLNDKEEYWILHYKVLDPNFGYNFIQRMDIRRQPRSEETKLKIRQALKRRYPNGKYGENNPFYGKHHSEETKKLVGLASLGRDTGQKKRVICFNDYEKREFDCITLAAKEFVLSRYSINRLIKDNKSYNGYFFQLV